MFKNGWLMVLNLLKGILDNKLNNIIYLNNFGVKP